MLDRIKSKFSSELTESQLNENINSLLISQSTCELLEDNNRKSWWEFNQGLTGSCWIEVPFEIGMFRTSSDPHFYVNLLYAESHHCLMELPDGIICTRVNYQDIINEFSQKSISKYPWVISIIDSLVLANSRSMIEYSEHQTSWLEEWTKDHKKDNQKGNWMASLDGINPTFGALQLKFKVKSGLDLATNNFKIENEFYLGRETAVDVILALAKVAKTMRDKDIDYTDGVVRINISQSNKPVILWANDKRAK